MTMLANILAIAFLAKDPCVASMFKDANGATWIRGCSWPSHLEAANQWSIDDMVNLGLLVPMGGGCYESTFSDATFCVFAVDGIDLLARGPADFAGVYDDAGCVDTVAWVVVKVSGDCWAQFPGGYVRALPF